MSGIYIPGMEMPKNCDCCDFMEVRGEYGEPDCPFGLIIRCASEKHPDCPLVPVPDHGRLIDADALCKTLRSLAENEYTPEVFANWIENHIDTIIQASKEGEG